MILQNIDKDGRNKAIKKTLIDNVVKPVCITSIAIVFIVFFNFNPIFLLFDLLVKIFSIISGYKMVTQLIDGTFDASSPIFIIYISVLILSFIVILIKIFKSSMSYASISKDFESNSNSLKSNKIKWILIWLISWLIMPFFFAAIFYTISLVINFIGINNFGYNLVSFNSNNWDTTVVAISKQITNNIKDINTWLENYFPNDINSITKLPNELDNTSISLEQYKMFLTNLSKDQKAIEFKENLLALKNLYSKLLSEEFFSKIYFNGGIKNLTITQTQNIVNDMIKTYNNISDFISNKQLFNYNNLLIAINNSAIKVNVNGSIIEPDGINKLSNIVDISKGLVNANTYYVQELIVKSPLDGICIYGIDGQKTGSNTYLYVPEKITVFLATLIYQQPSPSFHIYYDTNNLNNSSITILPSQIPLVGANFSSLNVDYNVNYFMRTLGSNPLQLVMLIISTLSFSICLFLFWKISTIYLFKLCNYIYMLFVSPFATSSGVDDNGEKFQIWFKDIMSKGLLLLIVALCVNLFSILINILIELLNNPNMNYLNMNKVNPSSNNIFSGATIESQLILRMFIMLIIYAICNGILELINYSSNRLCKKKKYS